MQETRVQSLGREDPLEKEMATHSSTLAWRIPWREKPGESRIQTRAEVLVLYTLMLFSVLYDEKNDHVCPIGLQCLQIIFYFISALFTYN